MPVSLRARRLKRRGRKDAVRDGAAPPATPRAISAAELKQLARGSYAAHQSLQEAVLKLLASFGVEAVPLHTGPRVAPREDGGFDLRTNKAQHGVADVMACLPPNGRLALIELKTGAARQSDAQKRTNARFERMGALCLEIRNALELMPHLTPARKDDRDE